jgi:hypothetical protein
MCYELLRYGIAYGDGNDGPFIGGANFALMQEGGATYHNFFFQVCMCVCVCLCACVCVSTYHNFIFLLGHECLCVCIFMCFM